ncbi:Eukaryotic translation initiation factor 3 subunit C like [Quillaja saponaria]|uniref:Eukaryotic translation initiation factor 3 subunit C like n=1 Tax=Quillaja saponaria TaxID=32244 RepID=A0AAD7LLB0_QUISA|nr:Eukaryotic translation initiation factor 3 subunit C like [Quillaja saponaria]
MDRMLFPLCFFKNPLSWLAVLASFLVFASYMVGFGFFAILLTSSVLVVSTVLLTISHQKLVMVDKLVEEHEVVQRCNKESSAQIEDFALQQMPESSETVAQTKQNQEEGFLSESESQDQLSTMDCCQSLDCSDGSISDEDSLIEIALPSGHYVGHREEEEEPNFNLLHQKKQEYPTDYIFGQCSLMEFLAEFNEMNEEENLIEIDISMGSIKYSRFEIEA